MEKIKTEIKSIEIKVVFKDGDGEENFITNMAHIKRLVRDNPMFKLIEDGEFVEKS